MVVWPVRCFFYEVDSFGKPSLPNGKGLASRFGQVATSCLFYLVCCMRDKIGLSIIW